MITPARSWDPITRTSGSARPRNPVTWCCFRATSCTRCRPIRASGASPCPSTRSPRDSTRGATRSRSAAESGSRRLLSPVTAAPPTAEWRRRLALSLMVASGFAALAYQIVWTQQATVWLGHEWAAVLAVVAAFFGGLSVGALALGPRVDRSERPARWYAACEAVIGLWSIALGFLMAPLGKWLLALTGEQPSTVWQWSVAFSGTFVLLLPATAAMGATLPAMERVMAQMRRRGSSIAVLYAGNTFGAVVGVLTAAFWLVPEFGLARTAAVCAALNLLCAAAALKVFAEREAREPSPTRSDASGALMLLAATGLLGIGFEVLVVRVLSQVTENTVYTFAMLLAVYLVGTAAGAAAYSRWRFGRERLLWMLAAACLIGTASLWGAEALKTLALRALGPSMSAALAAEATIAVAAFLLPTFMMGMVF